MATHDSEAPHRPSRVLVVDDDRVLLSFASQVLSTQGYTVDVAHDGKEALDKIAAAAPDLVILDLTMPVLDGFAVLAQLDRSGARIPVIVLSANPDPPRVRKLYSGVTAVLTKPLRISQLLPACDAAYKPADSGAP